MDIGNIIKTMNDRGSRKAIIGAPFYAPPKRKTSAEIISEARAAVYGESDESGASGGAGGAGGGAIRPLRTRRPFTPQESQRTLFSDRARRKEPRPPSAFKLKYVSESGEQVWSKSVDSGVQAASHSDASNGPLVNETHGNVKKKTRSNSRGVATVPEQSSPGEQWSGYTKLPNLSGRMKPLHRRSSNLQDLDSNKELAELASAIQITQSFPIPEFDSLKSINNETGNKKCSTNTKRNQYATKSWSCDIAKKESTPFDEDIKVKHINSADKKRINVTQNIEQMTVLELSESLLQRSRDQDRNKQLLAALSRAVEQNSCANNVREMALRALYTHVDTEDPETQVDIARSMFMLRVTGPHLATACKLVFKVAKNDKNDHFFTNTNLLELVLEGMALSSPVADSEVSVYGAGAVRVVAGGGGEARGRALRGGAVHLLGLHLKIINDVKSSRPCSPNEKLSHALYQITGALRNLAGGDPSAFLHAGVLNDILVGMHVHKTDRDVLTNLVRCLSVVSTCEGCLWWLCVGGAGRRGGSGGSGAGGAVGAVLRGVGECGGRGGLLVRLLYVLGNMAAYHHTARTNIYEEEGGVDILLTIIEAYAERSERMDARDVEIEYEPADNDMIGSRGTNEDVLIKAIRIFANLCLSEREGRSLAKNHFSRIGNALLRCLNIARRKQQQSDLEDDDSEFDRREELATASLATLNNVTYYRDTDGELDREDHLIDQLCQETCRWMVMYNSPASCEAVRALGNLTRSTRAAAHLVRTGAVSALEPFLRHEESSVRCGAAGVLVNVCGCGAGGAGEDEGDEGEGGEGVLSGGVGAAARGRDAGTGALLLRAVWNLHAHTPLHAHTREKVVQAIHVFIDDDSVFAPCEAQSTSPDRRRASDPDLSKNHVKFNVNNNEEYDQVSPSSGKLYKTLSVDQDINLDRSWDEEGCSGEDLGFEEGELVGDDGCDCAPCRRLAEWDELVAVAIPLLEKLKPVRSDASVGTEI